MLLCVCKLPVWWGKGEEEGGRGGRGTKRHRGDHPTGKSTCRDDNCVAQSWSHSFRAGAGRSAPARSVMEEGGRGGGGEGEEKEGGGREKKKEGRGGGGRKKEGRGGGGGGGGGGRGGRGGGGGRDPPTVYQIVAHDRSGRPKQPISTSRSCAMTSDTSLANPREPHLVSRRVTHRY